MPELPEVEVARRNMRRWLRGKRIEGAVVPPTRVVRASHAKGRGSKSAAETVVSAIVGRTVRSIDRRGKWLRIVLDDGTRVFSHFGLTGKWVHRSRDAPTERSERARIDVEHASVRYLDPRMFGRIAVSKDDVAGWTSLGPDPLVDGIDVDRLAKILARRKRTVKETLMDQKVLAGIGNIQATEALWRARIDPRTRTNALTTSDVRAIAKAVRWSIDRTLASEVGPELTYVEEDRSANPFEIYGRGGQPCPRCKTSLKRIVLGGRGTTFCPGCQSSKDRVGARRRA